MGWIGESLSAILIGYLYILQVLSSRHHDHRVESLAFQPKPDRQLCVGGHCCVVVDSTEYSLRGGATRQQASRFVFPCSPREYSALTPFARLIGDATLKLACHTRQTLTWR